MDFRMICRKSINSYGRSANCKAAGSGELVISPTWRNSPYALPENAIGKYSAPPCRRRLAWPQDTRQMDRVTSDVARGARARGGKSGLSA